MGNTLDIELQACLFSASIYIFDPQRAGTEFNYVNIIAADALAPYVARTPAAMISTM